MSYIESNNMILQKHEDGFYQLEHDQDAIWKFQAEVNSKMKKFKTPEQRFKWLVRHKYYYKQLLKEYSMEDILEIHNLARSFNFGFKSFMAISKFYQDYALMTNNKQQYLETYEDHNTIVALYYAAGRMDRARRYIATLMKQRYQPATPSYMNAGRARRGELVSCFLLIADDSLNSINYVLNCCGQLSKVGGGVSVNLSNLRAMSDPIQGYEGAAKGIMVVAKLMEDTFSAWDQMGQRNGSGAGYVSIFHLDADMLLHSKKHNADEKIRLKKLSTGLVVPHIFFELAERGEDFYQFSPYDIKKEYGIQMTDVDFDKMYYDLVANENIRKSEPKDTVDYLNEIAKQQVETGYPYLMYQTNANKFHPLRNLGNVSFSNLCTEIMQLIEVSEINDWGKKHTIRRDINCVLGSLNAYNVMIDEAIEESVYDGMDMLTDVVRLSNVKNAPGVAKANREMHSVGLGLMNLHGYLASQLIGYESNYALEFVTAFYNAMNYYSLKRSMEIAIELGETFEGFEKSDYADGSYFDHYLTTDYRPTTDRVKALFGSQRLPGPEDWTWLKGEVIKHGIYHSYRLAGAPTQSISYIQNSTQGFMPITDQVETRAYEKSKTYYPMPHLSRQNHFAYKSAYKMDMFNLIDIVAAAQVHVDQAISCILFVDSDIPTNELAMYYVYAAKKGLKSLYYTRSRELAKEECEACAV
ncbi:class 1b ribonucleoside-diphosphate reductase subunit alpha (plasmid) [Paenibacillus rhizovicinus]|uniref:Ribonucleoside-diphosphate reductase n=1 Tax=Paenibacillus rhizovicinus TaxID=2704463 RepID=A0A6C0PBC9_9BACL|nr:class 1b ribonucleoside-diphosphate reductase subunit alpha [Paenibacillus rhizovicinus]QHW35847.1 class 1b ribonucleoside-diphosphate reductase subunit alpha [Paenibacillus rhizovicinus]